MNADPNGADPGSRLTSIVFTHLRRLSVAEARRFGDVGERASDLLQETMLHLLKEQRGGEEGRTWKSQSELLRYAGRAMRSIMVDRVRRRNAQKRGGGAQPLELDEGSVPDRDPNAEVLALDDLLSALARVDRRKAEVFELSFFAGLSDATIAATLGISTRTARRDREAARAWLRTKLESMERGADRSRPA